MPIILTIAAMVAVVPPLMGWGAWQTWIYRALALIVLTDFVLINVAFGLAYYLRYIAQVFAAVGEQFW